MLAYYNGRGITVMKPCSSVEPIEGIVFQMGSKFIMIIDHRHSSGQVDRNVFKRNSKICMAYL